MCCFVVFFSFWPSLKIKLFSVKKIQCFSIEKGHLFSSLCSSWWADPSARGVQWWVGLSDSVCSQRDWWYPSGTMAEPKESCSLLLTEPLQAAGVIKPLLFLYCVIIETLSFSWGQMGAAHAPCLAYLFAWRSSAAIWAPRAQHDTMSQHYSNHTGLVSTASVWIINAELCVLETLQQWYQWLFRVGDIGGVVFNLFLAHMSLLFSVVVEIASLWTILQQQTSKVSELETNCIVDYFFFFQIFIPQEMKHVFYCFPSQGPGAVITKLPTQYGAVCPRSTPFSPISPSNITPFPPALSLTVLR